MLWVGCSERTTPGRCRNSSGRMPTQHGLRRALNTRFSSLMNRHVWVGSSSKPSAKNSINASRTVSAPPSTAPMDFMEEWIRMVSFPVSPIAARSRLSSAFVYAMSFLLFGHFSVPSLPPFARQSKPAAVQYPRNAQKSTFPAAFAGMTRCLRGMCPFSFLVKSCIQHIILQRCRETSAALHNYSNFTVISCFSCAFGTAAA